MATDNFASQSVSRQSPAMNCALVTPDDDTDLTTASRGIAFGGVGDLQVIMLGDNTETPITIPSGVLAAGLIHPLCVSRVCEDGTTATDIYVFW